MAAGLLPYLMSLDPAARTFTAQQTEKEANRGAAEAARASAGQALGVIPQLQMDDPSTRAFITADAAKVAARRLQQTGVPSTTVNAVAGADAARNDAGSGVDVGLAGPGNARQRVGGDVVSPSLPEGITRIDMPGESPVYTNKGAAGYEEIRGMRAPLPSVASALRNVPEMMSVLHPQAGGGGLVSPREAAPISLGGAPTFIPGTNGPTILGGGGDRLSALDEQIDKYTKPGSSIFDMWRGRQLEKRRDKLALAGVLGTNSEANMMQAVTGQQKLGVDANNALLTAAAHRYAADRTAGAHEMGVQADLLKNKGTIMTNERIQAALKRGDYATAQQLATLAHPPQPYGGITDLTLSGMPGKLAMPDKASGGVKVVDIAELVKQQAAETQAAKLEAEARARKGQ